MFLLTSLFSQFNNDILVFIPMGVMVWLLLIFVFFFVPSSPRTFLFEKFFWWGFNFYQMAAMGFVFRDLKKAYQSWIGFMYSLLKLLIFVNVSGLLPYSYPFSGQVSFTYSLTFPLWGSMQLIGFYCFFKVRVSHFLPAGTPWALVPLMVLMELVSLVMQPVALGLRLAAKMTAGHLLIFLFSVAVWNTLGGLLSFVLFLLLFLLFVLELGVAFVQAYVFISLLHFFFSQKVEEH